MTLKQKILISMTSLAAVAALVLPNVAHARTDCETGSYGQVTCREVPDEPVLGARDPLEETDAGLGDFISPRALGVLLLAGSGALFYRSKKAGSIA